MNVSFLLITLGLVFCLPAGSSADSCLTAECHAAIGGLAQQHQPVADGECLNCHTRTAAEHPVKGSKSFELVEQGAALCFQCHDELGKGKVVHDPVSEGDCLACHNPHGAANRFLLAVGADQSELCFECHDSEPFRQAYMHGPAAAGACTSCHDPHASGERALLKKSQRKTCLECHADFAAQMEAAQFIHEPVRESPCTECHDPHASAANYVLKNKMPDICLDCHEDFGDKLAVVKVRHEPVHDALSCGNCHSSHFSKSPNLLPDVEQVVCFGCHATDNLGNPPLKNIQYDLFEKPAPLRGKQKKAEGLKKKPYLHGPIKDKKCTGCHDPHGSDNNRILTGSYPTGIYAPYRDGIYNFCFKCHDKYMLTFEETTLYTEFRNGKSNLHLLHVNNKRKGRSCRICHEPHASDGQKLISAEGMPFGDWVIPINFKSTETGGSCAPGCHQSLAYDREQPVVYEKSPGSGK